MNDTPISPRGRLSVLTNAIVSGSATLIALVALATGLYQAKLSRDQANASVWPFLLQGNSGNNGYARLIQNVGIGPARVMAFEVLMDGRPMHSWRELNDSLHITLTGRGSRTTTMGAGVVIPANSVVDLIELPDSADVRVFRGAIAKKGKFDTWICYCSIYDKCWAGTGDTAPAEVRSCKNDPARAFHDD